MSKELHAVTGAFGYSGKYIAQKLLDAGKEVITLTNSTNRANPFGDKVKAYPYNFDNPGKLTESLKGVSVLYNTYWVRFDHKDFNHTQAIGNSLILFKAAKKAGVKRIVHISIANPSLDSKLPYYLGKALLEKAIVDSGMSYAILRPTVLFGDEDVLINNIAWMLRYLPVMGIFGDGKYKMCPIHIEDLAKLAVDQGVKTENAIINAIGPEVFVYKDLIKMLGDTVGKHPLTLHVPPVFGQLAGWAIGILMNDIVITKEEIAGLTANLLYVDAPPAGSTKLSEWARQNRDVLGVKYSSELARRRNRTESYRKL
jgi:nucleoside-diphosphate-sugar epimerase